MQQVQAVQRQKTGQEVIIFTPTKSSEEVIDLANRISDMFLSCGTYSPRFFESLDDMERKFYVSFRLFASFVNSKESAHWLKSSFILMAYIFDEGSHYIKRQN